MNNSATNPAARDVQTRLALGGLIALASGTGLGQFLHTPALPMMVEGAGVGLSALSTGTAALALAAPLWAALSLG